MTTLGDKIVVFRTCRLVETFDIGFSSSLFARRVVSEEEAIDNSMSAPVPTTEEEWRLLAEAHRDFVRLLLLREHGRKRDRENTGSLAVDASSVDDAGNGPTTYTSFSHNIQTVRARYAALV